MVCRQYMPPPNFSPSALQGLLADAAAEQVSADSYISHCMLLCVPCKISMIMRQYAGLTLYLLERCSNRSLLFAHHQLFLKLFVGVGQQR